jgi:hypothetical protein
VHEAIPSARSSAFLPYLTYSIQYLQHQRQPLVIYQSTPNNNFIKHHRETHCAAAPLYTHTIYCWSSSFRPHFQHFASCFLEAIVVLSYYTLLLLSPLLQPPATQLLRAIIPAIAFLHLSQSHSCLSILLFLSYYSPLIYEQSSNCQSCRQIANHKYAPSSRQAPGKHEV